MKTMSKYGKNKTKTSTKGLTGLRRIIKEAVRTSADSVTLQYVDGGFEVCYMFGNTGIGNLLPKRDNPGDIIVLLVKEANLRNSTKGSFRMAVHGREYRVAVREFEDFGESAFELRIREGCSTNKGAHNA